MALCILAGCSRRTAPPPSAPVAEEKVAAPKPAADIDTLVQAVVAAKDPVDAWDAYRQLLGAASDGDLQRLKLGPNDSVAAQAAWEEVERSLPVAPERPPVRPDRDRLAGFLKFLEGRAHVQAPPWWAEALLDARANRRFNVYLGGINIGAEVMPKGALAPEPAVFAREDGRLVVRVGSTSVPVAGDLPEKLEGDLKGNPVCALITRTRCYVAVHDPVGYPYRLAAVDRPSSKVRWVVKVWGSFWFNATGIPGQQWLEVTEQGDRVVAFGVAGTGFHVEAFRADDGANLFRFSNSYGAR